MTKEYKKYTVRMSKDVRLVAEVTVVASSAEKALCLALDGPAVWRPDVSERNEVIDIDDVEEVGS